MNQIYGIQHDPILSCRPYARVPFLELFVVLGCGPPFGELGLSCPPTCSPSRNCALLLAPPDRKSTRLNSSHTVISYAVFCLKKKTLTSYRSASPPCSLSGMMSVVGYS